MIVMNIVGHTKSGVECTLFKDYIQSNKFCVQIICLLGVVCIELYNYPC